MGILQVGIGMGILQVGIGMGIIPVLGDTLAWDMARDW